MKIGKRNYVMYAVFAAILCAAASTQTSWGKTGPCFQGGEGREAPEEVRPEDCSKAEEEGVYITRILKAGELDRVETPSQAYWSQDGKEYQLRHWEIKERPGHMINRRMEKQIVYDGVEGEEELPRTIDMTEEVTGALAEGKLSMQDTKVLKEEWQEGFSVPVTFHSYGAEEYEVGDLVISGENALSYSDELAGKLLSLLNLSDAEYRIHRIEWSGEPYVDSSGQICRQALAMGEKLLRDYQITYGGEICWRSSPVYEVEMLYAPIEQSPMEGELVEAVEKGTLVPPSEAEKSSLWHWVRRGFMITVSASFAGILIGMFLFVVLCIRQRRKRCFPQIKRYCEREK